MKGSFFKERVGSLSQSQPPQAATGLAVLTAGYLRLADVLLRLFVERFLTAGRAEVVCLPLVLGFASGSLFLSTSIPQTGSLAIGCHLLSSRKVYRVGPMSTSFSFLLIGGEEPPRS